MKPVAFVFRSVLVHALLASLCCVQVYAQEPEQLESILQRVPSAPPGLPVPPLPAGPLRFDTGEGFAIEVSVLGRGLSHPWGMATLPDGTIPADNPLVGTAGARPEIFTLGHRTIQGLVKHPQTGEIWSLEMGPNGGDEVNILKPGANYGWPHVSLGRDDAGPWQAEDFRKEGIENPVVYWMPSISVSGMTFYTGDRLAAWQGDLLVGGLRMGEIPGTGLLQRVRFNANGEEIRREALLGDLHYRIRGAHQGADGYLYVLTDEDEAAVLRIGPADL